MCGIAGIVMSAERISGFHLKVAFRIAIQMHVIIKNLAQNFTYQLYKHSFVSGFYQCYIS